MQMILGLIFAAINDIVALESNLYRITLQIRGNLNPVKGMAIAELSRRMNPVNCGETRRSASLLGWWYSPALIEKLGKADSFTWVLT